jgi:hypothetical protein
VGGLFFGLWLVPMGWVALRTNRFPRGLGWMLLIGSMGYVVAAFFGQIMLAPPQLLLNLLPMPATIGEFWMIGYLLSKGIRENGVE